MSRKPHQPTDQLRKQVKVMAALGMPQEDIGKVIGIDAKTLRLHYRGELDSGLAEVTAKIGANLVQTALGSGRDAFKAQQFFLKMRAGWVAPPAEGQGKPLGKKEQAIQDAAHPDPSDPMGDLMARRAASERLN